MVIDSLRNGSAYLLELVDEYQSEFALHTTRTATAEEIADFWVRLGTPHDFLDVFCEVNPIWNGTHLTVNVALGNDSHNKIGTCIYFGLQWYKFSETRWGGVAQMGRKYLISRTLGISQLWALAERNNTVSMDDLNGFSKGNNAALQRLLCLQALAASAGNVGTLMLMEDDRFPFAQRNCLGRDDT